MLVSITTGAPDTEVILDKSHLTIKTHAKPQAQDYTQLY